MTQPICPLTSLLSGAAATAARGAETVAERATALRPEDLLADFGAELDAAFLADRALLDDRDAELAPALATRLAPRFAATRALSLLRPTTTVQHRPRAPRCRRAPVIGSW